MGAVTCRQMNRLPEVALGELFRTLNLVHTVYINRLHRQQDFFRYIT